MFILLNTAAHLSRSPLVSIYFTFAWIFSLLLARSVWSIVQEATRQATRMHQIPCANCQFFTENYSLKCAVHPETALSEAAIDCPDYQSTAYSARVASELQNSTLKT